MNIKAVPLYGAVYITKKVLTEALYHAVDVDNPDWRALCGKPKPDNLMDDDCVWKEPADITCKACLAKLAKT